MGNEHSGPSNTDKSSSDGIRQLPGNCNSLSIELTMVNGLPEPLITVAGNMNGIRVKIIQIECGHGTSCAKRGTPDRPVEISGNCNHYKVDLISHGPPSRDLVRVFGNMNDIKVNTREVTKIKCDCAGIAPEAHSADHRSQAGETETVANNNDFRAASTEHTFAASERPSVPDQAPPAYEAPLDRTATLPANATGNTKVLLMSSISSLDGTETDDDAFTDAGVSRRSSLSTIDTSRI